MIAKVYFLVLMLHLPNGGVSQTTIPIPYWTRTLCETAGDFRTVHQRSKHPGGQTQFEFDYDCVAGSTIVPEDLKLPSGVELLAK